MVTRVTKVINLMNPRGTNLTPTTSNKKPKKNKAMNKPYACYGVHGHYTHECPLLPQKVGEGGLLDLAKVEQQQILAKGKDLRAWLVEMAQDSEVIFDL